MSQLKHSIRLILFIVFSLLETASSTLAAAVEEGPALSAQITGSEFVYAVQRGDSLTSVGARFGVPVNTLASANGISAKVRLKENQQLRVDNRHIIPATLDDGILINIPQRMLFYFKAGRLLHYFPVGLGRADWPTPTGRFTVRSKEENPVWDVPKSIQEEMRREGKPVLTCVPPGPENPLGKHWLGLSLAGYGIHGTSAPTSIYQFRTHGCIRLHPDDVAELFANVSPGVPGLLIYRRLLVAKIYNQIFLEVHPDIYGKERDAVKRLADLVRRQDLAVEVDWDRAKDIIQRQEGIARAVTKGAPSVNAGK